MSKINNKTIKHIAQLSYLHPNDKEIELMRDSLGSILEKFQKLSEIDTNNILPTGHPSDVFSYMRDDTESDHLEKKEVLKNAPSSDGTFILVKPVLD